jgi:hypothetical protein
MIFELSEASLDLLLNVYSKQVVDKKKLAPLAYPNTFGSTTPNSRVWFDKEVLDYRFPGHSSIPPDDLLLSKSAAVLYETIVAITKSSGSSKSKWKPWAVLNYKTYCRLVVPILFRGLLSLDHRCLILDRRLWQSQMLATSTLP